MPVEYEKSPVEDSVAKVNNEIAVGSDLAFQRRWWRYERFAWIFFAVVIVLDALGLFGRGPIANAQLNAPDDSFIVKYERIERFRTPSILSVLFAPQAIHHGQVQLWLAQTLVDPLGNQRIIPQPSSSQPLNGGILYTFEVGDQPVGNLRQNPTIQFALEPGSAGVYPLEIGMPGSAAVHTKIYVMP